MSLRHINLFFIAVSTSTYRSLYNSLRFDFVKLTSQLKSPKKMKVLLALFAILLLAVFCQAGIVEENGICIDEIKSLETCLKAAGEGQGWCEIGKTVNFRKTKRKSLFNLLLFTEPTKAADVCATLMKKMNDCIKGKSS